MSRNHVSDFVLPLPGEFFCHPFRNLFITITPFQDFYVAFTTGRIFKGKKSPGTGGTRTGGERIAK
ncbi:hypothetical protein YPD27_C0003 (plasmid) [Yersinia pestis KIM D27]|nr:hypothetical protein YPD27_C0003 [Yersinia pestis KIM D27]